MHNYAESVSAQRINIHHNAPKPAYLPDGAHPDANTRVLSVLAIGLTVSRLRFSDRRQSLPCPAEEALSYRRKARSAPQDTPYRTPEKPFLRRPFRPSDASFTLHNSMRPDAEEPVPHRSAMPEERSGFLFHDFPLSKHFTTRTHIYALPRLSSTPLLTCLRPARKPRTPYRRPADAPTPQLFAATGRILKKND